jgi:hypothetical protein
MLVATDQYFVEFLFIKANREETRSGKDMARRVGTGKLI